MDDFTMAQPLPFTLFRVLLSCEGEGTGEYGHIVTYTATEADGTILGTGLTPERPREGCASQPAISGAAYFNASGEFVLAEAWETILTTTCA